MQKIFITGSGGLVGSRFVELYVNKYKLLTPEIDELDLTDKTAVEKFIKKEKPDCIIHFAAYTNVSEAENQRDDRESPCQKVNVDATRNLIESINPARTHFIHISTDMIFSGSEKDPGPYDENHELENDPERLTWYGYTKKIAEDTIKNILTNNYTIVRLIYPVRAKFDGKLDYLRTPLKLFDEGKLYPLFSDQQISICYIDEACVLLDKIIMQNIFGTMHASTPDTTTPFEIVSYMIKRVRNFDGNLKKIKVDKFLKTTNNKTYRYPKYGGLKVNATEIETGMKFSSWKQVVDKLIEQGLGN